MLVKCICNSCAGHLEFEEENAGEQIDCPHCGFETTLFLPGNEPAVPSASAFAKLLRFRKQILIGAAVLLVVIAGWLTWKWGLPFVRSLLPDETGTIAALFVLLLACLVLVGLLLWLAMPVFIFIYGRKLLRVLNQIEQNLVPVASPEPDELSPFERVPDEPSEEEEAP
jgi:hypothetical protein